MFKRKGKLRKEVNDGLLTLVGKTKDQWLSQKKIIENSIEPSDEVLYQLKLAELRYIFLLKEAKQRRISFEHIY